MTGRAVAVAVVSGPDPVARRGSAEQVDEHRAPALARRELARNELTTRVTQLTDLSTLLVGIADTAIVEADDEGRVGRAFSETRLPLARKRPQIATTALAALGGPDLEAARKLVTEPLLFKGATVSAVLSALDEVNAELETLRT